MSGPPSGYQISVNVTVYRRSTGGDRMSLTRDWEVDENDSAQVFHTLAEFSELADTIKARETVRHE